MEANSLVIISPPGLGTDITYESGSLVASPPGAPIGTLDGSGEDTRTDGGVMGDATTIQHEYVL